MYPWVLGLTLGLLAGAPAIAAMPLANYRSVHDLTLAPGAELGEVGSIRARLVTEFTGSSCAGYTTKVRFVTRSTGDNNESRTDDIRSETFETESGLYQFAHETYSEDELVDRTVGTATRGSTSTAVELTEPAEKTFKIGTDVAFPTEQVRQMIAAAIDGKKFIAVDLYDGTEGGESLYGTANVIGRATTSADDLGEETSVADAGFAAQRHWPMRISYFPKEAGADMTPDYVMSLIVYENGVSRDVRLDYGPFALIGKLTQLEMLATPECPG